MEKSHLELDVRGVSVSFHVFIRSTDLTLESKCSIYQKYQFSQKKESKCQVGVQIDREAPIMRQFVSKEI